QVLENIHDEALDTTAGATLIQDYKERRFLLVSSVVVNRYVRLCTALSCSTTLTSSRSKAIREGHRRYPFIFYIYLLLSHRSLIHFWKRFLLTFTSISRMRFRFVCGLCLSPRLENIILQFLSIMYHIGALVEHVPKL